LTVPAVQGWRVISSTEVRLGIAARQGRKRNVLERLGQRQPFILQHIQRRHQQPQPSP
jgi:hypothetical protein